jgi:hypothetical protein
MEFGHHFIQLKYDMQDMRTYDTVKHIVWDVIGLG